MLSDRLQKPSNFSELTPEHQKFINEVIELQLNHPLKKINEFTKESLGNISNYLSGKKTPGERFLQRFYKFYKKEENILEDPEYILEVNEPEVPYNKHENSTLKAILKMANANELLAQSNKILAENNRDLIVLMKTTANGAERTLADVDSKFAALLELIADAAVDAKKYKSKHEAVFSLSKLYHDRVH